MKTVTTAERNEAIRLARRLYESVSAGPRRRSVQPYYDVVQRYLEPDCVADLRITKEAAQLCVQDIVAAITGWDRSTEIVQLTQLLAERSFYQAEKEDAAGIEGLAGTLLLSDKERQAEAQEAAEKIFRALPVVQKIPMTPTYRQLQCALAPESEADGQITYDQALGALEVILSALTINQQRGLARETVIVTAYLSIVFA